MKGRGLLVFSVCAALAGVGAAVLAGVLLADGGDRPATSGRAAGTVAVEPHAPKIRGTDPVTGATVALGRVKEKPVLLHVWASWCGPCARGAHVLQEFVHRHRRKVVVLGLDYQDDPEDAKAFYEQFGWTFRSISDPDGRLAARLGIANVPATVALDEQHLIVRRIAGIATREQLAKALADATRN